MVIKNLCEVVI